MMKDIRQYIDKVLGSSIRCLLPSYWWKRIFGLIVDEVEDVRKVANNKADKSYVDKTIDDALDNVTIAVDTELSTTSKKPVQNKVVTAEINKKQDKLVSGVNIVTINGQSLLGGGNISYMQPDSYLSTTSTNVVQNKVITNALNNKQNKLTIDSSLSPTSTNPVQNMPVAVAISQKQNTLVSGVNIKTINGTSVLGSGDITIEATGGVSEEVVAENEKVTAQALVDLNKYKADIDYVDYAIMQAITMTLNKEV